MLLWPRASPLGGIPSRPCPPGRALALDPSPLEPGVIYNYGESETARSGAMGGALRALGDGTTGIFLNPAAMAQSRVYHIEARTQITPETRSWLLGATVIDSVTSRLAGSFSPSRARPSPPTRAGSIAPGSTSASPSLLPLSAIALLSSASRAAILKATQSGNEINPMQLAASPPSTSSAPDISGSMIDASASAARSSR